ncbi:MAG: hypothetical protein R3C05_23750 [Pirellulaceae bacterium]
MVTYQGTAAHRTTESQDNLRPLVDALEKADAQIGPNGPLLEEHYIFCERFERLKKEQMAASSDFSSNWISVT